MTTSVTERIPAMSFQTRLDNGCTNPSAIAPAAAGACC